MSELVVLTLLCFMEFILEGFAEFFLFLGQSIGSRYFGKGRIPKNFVILSPEKSEEFLRLWKSGEGVLFDGEYIVCSWSDHNDVRGSLVGKDAQRIPRWYCSAPRQDGSRVCYALRPLFFDRWWYIGASTTSVDFPVRIT